MEPQLPSFCARRSIDRARRPGTAQHQMAASYRHRAAVPQADARGRIATMARVAMVTFWLITGAMAVYAIHQEERLAPHERQLLQEVR